MTIIIEFICFFIILLCISCVLCLYRLIKGPSLADRIMALNALTVIGIGIAVLTGLIFNELFIDLAIPLALITYVSAIILTRYLEGEI
jgi:Multiple resistance and pH regulation protein F (MrpF / PhaF).